MHTFDMYTHTHDITLNVQHSYEYSIENIRMRCENTYYSML